MQSTGEIASVAFNNGEGITWGETEFSLYPWWIGTVAEAVFMVGAERNADKIIGATYAPFMMNMDGYQWSPTNLAFNADPSDTTRSTSWHVYEVWRAEPSLITICTLCAVYADYYHYSSSPTPT
jgi:alpha-N-arabinofuranosidase